MNEEPKKGLIGGVVVGALAMFFLSSIVSSFRTSPSEVKAEQQANTIKKIETELEKEKTDRKTAESALAEINKEKAALAIEKTNLKEKVSSLIAERLKIDSFLDEMKTKATEIAGKLATKRDAIVEKDKQITDVTGKLLARDKRIAELEGELAKTDTKKVAELQKQLVNCRADLLEQQQKNLDLQKRIRELENTVRVQNIKLGGYR